MTPEQIAASLELADRCEKATGPDARLDREIAHAVNGGGAGLHPLPSWIKPFTASLDAAMTLAAHPALRPYGGQSGMLREAMDRLAKQFALHMRRWPEDQDYAQWLARFTVAAALRSRTNGDDV